MIQESLGLDPFHDDQYVFKRRRDTVDALCHVVDLTDWVKINGKIPVSLVVGVKNAFSTLS